LTKKGELLLIDKSLINAQKGLIKDVIKTLIKNFSFKDGLKGISLPIRVFKQATCLDQICVNFSNLKFLKLATEAVDLKEVDLHKMHQQRVRRLKFILTFMLSGFIHLSESRKPMNNFIGETLQGRFPDGTRFYIERVKHFKPTEAFYFVNEELGFKIYGSLEVIGNSTKYVFMINSFQMISSKWATKLK
jgi:hypothetical protein